MDEAEGAAFGIDVIDNADMTDVTDAVAAAEKDDVTFLEVGKTRDASRFRILGDGRRFQFIAEMLEDIIDETRTVELCGAGSAEFVGRSEKGFRVGDDLVPQRQIGCRGILCRGRDAR